MAEDSSHQLFGYDGLGLKAFGGEFTFNTKRKKPEVIFQLIDETGAILEKHVLSYKQISPP